VEKTSKSRAFNFFAFRYKGTKGTEDMSDSKSRYAVWAIVAAIAVMVAIIIRRKKNGGNKTKLSVGRHFDSNVGRKKKLVYSNGDSITFYDAWRGNIPYTSIFSPGRPDWYFDISGLDNQGKVIFSSGWHNQMVLSQVIPKYEDIKRWQIVAATHLGDRPSSDVYKKLRIE
jgi:hypothetical protein